MHSAAATKESPTKAGEDSDRRWTTGWPTLFNDMRSSSPGGPFLRKSPKLAPVFVTKPPEVFQLRGPKVRANSFDVLLRVWAPPIGHVSGAIGREKPLVSTCFKREAGCRMASSAICGGMATILSLLSRVCQFRCQVM